MSGKNRKSASPKPKSAEVWTDDEMRNAKPCPLPEVPESPEDEPPRPTAPCPQPRRTPGLIRGVPPEDE